MSEEAKVVSLFGGCVTPSEEAKANAIVVEVLEDYLQRAKAGELIGIVIAGRNKDNLGEYIYGGHLGMSVVGSLHAAAAKLIRIDDL